MGVVIGRFALPLLLAAALLCPRTAAEEEEPGPRPPVEDEVLLAAIVSDPLGDASEVARRAAAAVHAEDWQAAYERFVPEWFEQPKPPDSVEQVLAGMRTALEESGRFGDIEQQHWPHSRSFGPEEYVRLVSTYSDHATIPEPRRSQLFEALAQAIRDAGGTIERQYEMTLTLARAADH